jgi:ABC-type amino acid transport substrate-binding protein
MEAWLASCWRGASSLAGGPRRCCRDEKFLLATLLRCVSGRQHVRRKVVSSVLTKSIDFFGISKQSQVYRQVVALALTDRCRYQGVPAMRIQTLRLALLVSIAGVWCGLPMMAQGADTLDTIRLTRTIHIAHRESSLPFSYLNENQVPVGYAVDLCKKIAGAVQRELKLPTLRIVYLPVTSVTRIPAIVEGKADLECGSTTNNAERRKQVAFTIPHFVATVRMLVRADSGIKNWVDLRGKTVVTTKGTTTIKLLKDRDTVRSLDLKIVEGADHAASFVMVEDGMAEAFTMDDALLFGLRASAKAPEKFVVTGAALSAEPYAIMLRKDDPNFKRVVDLEMARLINDGELNTLYKKWFEQPISPRGINMMMPMHFLLRTTLQYPSDSVGD